MGWGCEPSWLSSQRIRLKPFRVTCHSWYIWFLLRRSFSIPKYLHIHEKSISISSSSNGQVNIYTKIISKPYPFQFVRNSNMGTKWIACWKKKKKIMLKILKKMCDCFSNLSFLMWCSMAFCLFMYTTVAICGYLMFGDSIKSQFTLNMPEEFVASKIAIWTTVWYEFWLLFIK